MGIAPPGRFLGCFVGVSDFYGFPDFAWCIGLGKLGMGPVRRMGYKKNL